MGRYQRDLQAIGLALLAVEKQTMIFRKILIEKGLMEEYWNIEYEKQHHELMSQINHLIAQVNRGSQS